MARKRTPPRPVASAAPAAGEEADWDIKVSTKVANPDKPSFDVGSNNAPILD